MLIQMLLLIWLGMAAVQGAETGLSVRQEGNQLVVEGLSQTSVDRATARAVPTDYSRFPEFVPGIHSNQVVESKNGVKLIEERGEVIFRPFSPGLRRADAGRGTSARGARHPFPYRTVQGCAGGMEHRTRPSTQNDLLYAHGSHEIPVSPTPGTLHCRTAGQDLGGRIRA